MNTQAQLNDSELGYVVTDQGDEVAITEEMINNSLQAAEDICLGVDSLLASH